jgi:hypothetical protein
MVIIVLLREMRSEESEQAGKGKSALVRSAELNLQS